MIITESASRAASASTNMIFFVSQRNVGIENSAPKMRKQLNIINYVAIGALSGSLIGIGALAALTFTPFVVVSLPIIAIVGGALLISALVASVAIISVLILKAKMKATDEEQEMKRGALLELNHALERSVDAGAPEYLSNASSRENLTALEDSHGLAIAKLNRLLVPSVVGLEDDEFHVSRLNIYNSERGPFAEFVHCYLERDTAVYKSYYLPLDVLNTTDRIQDLDYRETVITINRLDYMGRVDKESLNEQFVRDLETALLNRDTAERIQNESTKPLNTTEIWS